MKKTKLLLLSLLTLVSSSMWGQSKGDVITFGAAKYNVVSDNMITNGTFDDGFTGWTGANDFSTTITSAGFRIDQEDTNNYLVGTTNSGGGDAKSLGTAWALEKGKSYFFTYRVKSLTGASGEQEYLVTSLTDTKSTETAVLNKPTLTANAWTTVEVLAENVEYAFLQVKFRWLASNFGFDDFKLFEIEVAGVDKTALNTEIGNANTLLAGIAAGTNWKTALSTAITSAQGVSAKADATVEEVNGAINALKAAEVAAKETEAAYQKVLALATKATNEKDNSKSEESAKTTLATAITTAKTNAFAAETAAEINAVYNTLETARQAYVNVATPTGYPLDVTYQKGNVAGNANRWAFNTDAQNKVYKASTEKNTDEYIADGFIENWKGSNFTGDITYTFSGLPAGHYRVSAYAFDNGMTGNVYFYAGNVENEAQLATTTDKFTNPVVEDVLVGQDSKMKVGLNIKTPGASWIGIANIRLEYFNELSDAEKLPAAKAALQSAISGAKPAPTANIGNEAFQYSASAVEAYSKALVDAQGVYDNASATLAEVNEAIASLAFPTLNGPKANTRYALVLKYDGWAYDNKAVTYIANGRPDAGNYNIQYLTPVNVNYAQAFIFTPVEGDKYKLSQIDADDNERFISTGVPYGGNTSQIRTTTTATDALVVEVRATATEGKWNLWNTEANNYIGSQDAGFFTVNSHIDFEIVEAKEIPGISVPAVGYATYIAPADVTIPSGVKAYSCDGAEGTALVLTEVTNTIPKDKPVILIAAGGYSDDTTYGYSNMNPKSETFTEEPLVGTYVDTPAPAGSYVLQDGSEGAKFYKVSGEAGQQPTVKANHVYLYFPASEVRAFALEDATGIETIHNSQFIIHNDDETYNLAGQRVGNDFKGIVIKNGKKQLNK